jgi:hypothetical protein
MNRITQSQLQGKIDLLNELTGNPLQQYSLVDGKYRSQIGNYHLSMQNGGYALYRTVNEGGGINDIFSRGHGTKRELHERICAYILGIETKLNQGAAA